MHCIHTLYLFIKILYLPIPRNSILLLDVLSSISNDDGEMMICDIVSTFMYLDPKLIRVIIRMIKVPLSK